MTPHEFLKSEFQKRRDRNPNYSLRAFARWLQISPAQVSQILSGQRPVTLKTLQRVVDRMSLSPLEAEELAHEILRSKKLVPDRELTKTGALREDQFAVIADWYHLAILSLTRVKGAQADPRWIARRLGISVEQAHEALQRLVRLGLIETKPKFRQTRDPFEVVSGVPSPAIRKYHQQNLALASEKLETVAVELRDFQSLSLPAEPALVGRIKKLTDQYLAKVRDICGRSNASDVYHLNVQFFPVTAISPHQGEQ